MSNQNGKVFIVDDEHLLSEMLTDYLLGHHPNLDITHFQHGKTVLRIFMRNPL